VQNKKLSRSLTMKYIITMFIFTLAFSANAQVSTQPVQPPWYYYWPTENADNFQYSELGNSSLRSGNGLQRRSNIDVNKQLESAEKSVLNGEMSSFVAAKKLLDNYFKTFLL